MDQVYEDALKLHREQAGKLEVKSKVPLETRADLSLAYTPGVGQVCVEIGKDPALARVYTLKRNTVAVVSDGSAILGLGNLGPEAAIPVMEGKAVLFKKFANVDAFPICLSTQDVDEIVATVERIAPVFGGINLEDIAAPRCFEVERRLRASLSIPVLHDDQHGTATVVLAGLMNALAVVGKTAADVRVVFAGAGAAGIATAKLLLRYGVRDVLLCDRQGVIYEGRPGIDGSKAEIAAITNKTKVIGDLTTALVGADVFIGVSGPGLVSPEMIRTMNDQAIVFALSNPVPEIMPDLARQAGAAVVATGRSDFPNQVNNALVFPGVFRGALDAGVRDITDTMLIAAATALSAHVGTPSAEKILPSILDEGVATAVASAIHS